MKKYVHRQVQKHRFFSYLCYHKVTPPTCFGTGFGLVLIRGLYNPRRKVLHTISSYISIFDSH